MLRALCEFGHRVIAGAALVSHQSESAGGTSDLNGQAGLDQQLFGIGKSQIGEDILGANLEANSLPAACFAMRPLLCVDLG